jgi:hypothetical protein
VFRSLPVRDPVSLVQIQLFENNLPVHVSYPLYRQLAAGQQAFDGLFALSDFPLRQAVLRGRGSFRPIRGSIVTGNYFHVLGVSARTGRVFTEADDRPAATPVIVLSDAFWNREFGRSPSAIGQVLEINGASGTVIGVTPPEFFGETVGTVPDVWLPISFQPQFMPADWLNAPSHSWLTMRKARSTRSTVGSRCRPRNSRSASIVSNCNRPAAASTFWNNVSDDRSGCWSASPAWCS